MPVADIAAAGIDPELAGHGLSGNRTWCAHYKRFVDGGSNAFFNAIYRPRTS